MIDAALSLNVGNQIRSLVIGKRADFILHEFSGFRELAYFIAAPVRSSVFIAGKDVTL